MFRQVQGEALDVGDVLTWAPGYYYQKRFFSGHVHHFDGVPSDRRMTHPRILPDSIQQRFDTMLKSPDFHRATAGIWCYYGLRPELPRCNDIGRVAELEPTHSQMGESTGGGVGYAHSGAV